MSVRSLSLTCPRKRSATKTVGICERIFFEKYVYLPEKLSDNGCHFKKLVPLSERERKKESSFFYFQIVAQLELSLFFLKLTFMIKKVFFGFRQLHFLSIKKLDVASIINFEQSHFFTANFNVKHFLLK